MFTTTCRVRANRYKCAVAQAILSRGKCAMTSQTLGILILLFSCTEVRV